MGPSNVKPKILIVDDDKNIGKMISITLQKQKRYECAVALSGEACLQTVREDPPDLILLDIQMPGIDGLETLERLRQIEPNIPVVMMSAHGTIERAVRSMKLGAHDFIEKPFASDRLLVTVENALITSSLKREVSQLRSELRNKYSLANIIGESGPMQEVFRAVEKVIDSNVTVLIQGE
ncbi:MAG: response regulator, partial [candidate division KSB1 bacterium]|nr:response regulator [candidate division KSB1 bacterium]